MPLLHNIRRFCNLLLCFALIFIIIDVFGKAVNKMKQANKLKSPPGVSDIYGRDCVLKARTSEKIRKVFELGGYSEIQTPAFEYLEVFGDDMSISSDETIKFIDQSGGVLALRPDMTTSISRAVASHLSNEPLPLRLWYMGNVYRGGESYRSAKRREFTQAGVELIGANTPEADAEIIALTIRALLACSLSDFQIELAHSDFLQGVIDDCRLSSEDEDTLRSLLDKKFAIGIEEFCDSRGIFGQRREILTEAPSLFGEYDEIISRYKGLCLNPASQKALSELEEVCSIVASYGLEKYITVDLGQIRSFRYYTGVIFRGLTTSSAFPICGGGRYDTLGRRFNLDCPATGVAIWVDRLADALLRSNLAGDISPAPDAIVFYDKENRAEAYFKAEALRAEGKRTVLDVCSPSKDEALKSAEARGIKEVYFV